MNPADPPQPLDRLLRAAQPQPPADLAGFIDRLQLVCRLATMLQEAHAEGRYHGAMRPAHVLVSPQGGVGLDGWGGEAEATDAYRAPECAAGAPATAAGDMYGLGAILWELLTLRPPLVVEENLTRFHRRKQAGEQDPLPSDIRCRVPADLLAIARKGMAPDPALRWQGMEELLTALRGWMQRLESVAITLQAEHELAAAAQGHGEARLVATTLRSALALWPGNPAALDGLSSAEGAQAIAAIREGDEAGASGHLGQLSGATHAAVNAELHLLQARNQRRRWSFAVLAGVLLLIAAVAVWTWRQEAASTWRSETQWDFSRGAGTSGLESTWRDVHLAEPLAPPDGDGLSLPPGRIVWLRSVDGRGDVRLGIDVTWTRQIDGIELMLAAPRIQPPASFMTQPGYSCQFGGFRGTQTFLSSSAEAGWPLRPAPIAFAFTPGRRYRLELERQGEHLRLRVDGTVVWDQREVVPIGDSSFRWLALRTWAQVKVARIEVEKPAGAPASVSLATADALADAGHHADALAVYRASLRGDLPPAQRHQAIAKAHLVAARLPDRDEERRQLLRLAEESIPEDSPYLSDVLQAEALCRWQARDWQPALQLAGRVQRRYPGTRCALDLLGRRVDGVPPSTLTALLGLVASGSPVSHLDLAGLGLADLTPLRGMRLESLDISGNRIADLAPLAGMPLRRLVCADNLISDLAPLAGMQLVRLDAGGNRISGLAPLAGMPMERLNLEGNAITDLAPLARMPIEFLRLERNPLASLAPLAGCVQLADLAVSDAPLSDLAPLPFVSLRILSVQRCPVRDLAPLAASRLVWLDLSGTQVSELGALPRATIESLTLAGTPVSGLASLAGLALYQLDLSGTPLASLEGIAGITMFRNTRLVLDRTRVASLAPLMAPALDTLSIRGTAISDLGPLAGRALNQVLADGIPVANVWALTQVSGLQRLSLLDTAASATALDALADHLEREMLLPAVAGPLRIQAAIKAQDWRRLRAMARRIGAYDRLPLPAELGHAEAAALASAAGARLPCPLDRADLRLLANHPAITGPFWVGLKPRSDPAGIPRWVNGRIDPNLALMIRPQADPYAGTAWSCPPTPAEPLLQALDAISGSRYVVLEW